MPPSNASALPASALLGIDGATLRTVELGLPAGTPGLAAIGVIIAAVTVGLRSGGAALSGLLVIPLAVPLLIFGAGSLSTGGEGGIAAPQGATAVTRDRGLRSDSVRQGASMRSNPRPAAASCFFFFCGGGCCFFEAPAKIAAMEPGADFVIGTPGLSLKLLDALSI